MAKRKSQKSLPKGLPLRKKARLSTLLENSNNINPFENARASSSKSPKFHVHNRPLSGRINSNNSNISNNNPTKGPGSALKRAIDNRRNGLKMALQKSKKVGSFIDRRIGQKSHQSEMTEEERMLARIVRERSRRSKRIDKFALGDDSAGGGGGDGALSLTHRGKVIDDTYTGQMDANDIILSDDDDDRYGGQLERADTELHFGGGAFDKARRKEAINNPYGPSGASDTQESMGDRYRSRKEELDDLIMRKKFEKAQKAKHKEEQNEKFEDMDTQFKELAALLNFRDKEKDRKDHAAAVKAGTLSTDDQEMDDWEKEMKAYIFERKVKATDRTKTPDEIAKEEADKLHELETKRLARMNGDFENDDLSDISDDEHNRIGKNKKMKKSKSTRRTRTTEKAYHNPDELDSDDEDDPNELETRFTADGLVYVDKDGYVVKKVGEDEDNEYDDDDDDDDEVHRQDDSSDDDDDDDDDCESLGASEDDASVESDDGLSSGEEDADLLEVLPVGTKIKGKYRADEQFEGKGKWYKGTITKTYTDEAGNTLYDVEYDDGDTEDGMKSENVRRQKSSKDERLQEEEKKQKIAMLQEKRQKAKNKARTEIPYVFEVPTTLEALHDVIGNYAATGKDASLIIERIYKGNSVRLDKRNKEKMQNFYDVLLRRFVGVGDALCKSGDGGEELGRYNQLDSLCQVLYSMAQDSPDTAAAVFGRRIGIFQNAHAKRLRDSELVGIIDENFTAWPSTGTLLLLRALMHIFPATDKRHVVVTPTIILLGQIIGQTPIRSLQDIIRGLFCCGLMVEFTREAKRLPIEALSFLAGVLYLYSNDANVVSNSPIPTFLAATKFEEVKQLRKNLAQYFNAEAMDGLSLEREKMQLDCAPGALLKATLQLINKTLSFYCASMGGAETEIYEQITKAVLSLNPGHSMNKFPDVLAKEVRKTAESLRSNLNIEQPRAPLSRRAAAKASELSIKTLAPRMEDPNKYSMAKDKGKTQMQAERDKLRREYRREHKAVSRELRLDAAFIESERRKEKETADAKAREQRNKNYAWLEQEQATINQQVAQGGGLLKGGGIGAARSKARSGKLGIKKGGKLR